jgi:hypothetical protein
VSALTSSPHGREAREHLAAIADPGKQLGAGVFQNYCLMSKAKRKLHGLLNLDLVRNKPMPGQGCST